MSVNDMDYIGNEVDTYDLSEEDLREIRMKIVKKAIDLNATIKVREFSQDGGNTPLMLAAMYGYDKIFN